jgi:ribulose 1,5-bisphosphate carboxylase large subunit-like protein
MPLTTTHIWELSDAGPDGTRLGQSATDKIAFFGATPGARKGTTSFAQVPAATSSVATTTTLETVSNNNRNRINTLLTELIAKGLIASA